MSRSTQYIGLNSYALKFVEKATRVEEYPMTTGMFDETIMGSRFHMPVPEGANKAYYFEEIEQVAPWSSGPMIFTCLKSVLIKDDGEVCEDDSGYESFRWMLDPSLQEERREVDRETGRYYV